MDNNIKGRSQSLLAKCWDIMSDYNVKLARDNAYSKFGLAMSKDCLLFPAVSSNIMM